MQRGIGEAGGRGRGKAATRLKALKNEILVCPGRASMTAELQLATATIADVEAKLAVRTPLGAPVVDAVDNRATLSSLLDICYATDATCMLRLHAHIEKQRALAKFANDLKAVHGKPGTYAIAVGDRGRSGHGGTASAALRGQPPGTTITMTLSNVLQSRGHIIGVVPEAYKSRHCLHPSCTGICEYNCFQSVRRVRTGPAHGSKPAPQAVRAHRLLRTSSSAVARCASATTTPRAAS